jgi:3',5'-cyclic AMP phosphodiesterase CpdA
MLKRELSRRDWLKAAAISVGAGLIGGCANEAIVSRGSSVHPPARFGGGSIRVAHLTDVHVQPELDAPQGMAEALHHAQSLRRKPDFILNTGDCVMEALHADQARMKAQWQVWRSVLKNECSLPIEHCIGNHDIWGWSKERSGTTGNEPGWGKAMAMEQLGLARPYHAFDRGAWKFIMLDSVQPSAEGIWETRLDEAQFAWLENELKSTSKPVLIASHIPIVSPSTLLDSGRISGTPEYPALSPRRTHMDVKKLGALFRQHPNVKLCVSGHLHQIDRADFLGVTYITNPAVCGDWWQGLHRGLFGEMYTVLDLHPDGTFDFEYVDYGWEPKVPATRPTFE